jgi:hypothetical protein
VSLEVAGVSACAEEFAEGEVARCAVGQQAPGGAVEPGDVREHPHESPATAAQARGQAAGAAVARVAQAAARAADRHAHLRGLGPHAKLGEQPGEQRVRALVVDDETGVDRDLPDQVGVGVAAQPAIGLEQGHVVGPGQDVAGGQPADPAADDGDPAPGHGHAPFRCRRVSVNQY